jgi:hypothetical protein
LLPIVKSTLADLLGSKKAMAALGAAVAYVATRVAGHYGLALDDATASQVGDRVVALALAYLGSQALADHGSVAAQIHADTTLATTQLPPPAPPTTTVLGSATVTTS